MRRDERGTPIGVATRSLPQPLTSFIGRERELAEVGALLARDDVRLVTLTGPGGVGKTRLALRLAESGDAFSDGTWFVDLAPLYDPNGVALAVAQALGVRASGTEPVAAVIAAELRGQRALLVLDNFEQLLDAAVVVAELLAACPELTVLVTSRVPLRLSGEYRYQVPPLRLADSDRIPPVAALEEVAAVRLFAERARATLAEFALTDANAAAVAALCAQLDGLPLAIELAAARANVFGPAEMLKRLAERRPVLGDGPRDAPARLRSMPDSIGWSYQLLAPDEQALFRQLGALVGTWSLAAAEAVAGAEDDAARQAVLERLAALIDASLVRREALAGGATGYRMLVPIHEMAAALLDASDEADDVRRRHAAFITDIALAVETAVYLPDGEQRIARMRLHVANIPLALAWLEAQGDADGMLRLAGALPHFWNGEGRVLEGIRWLERAVALGRDSESPHLGYALVALAILAHMYGNEAGAQAMCREGRQLVEAHGTAHERLRVDTAEGIIALRSDDLDHAEAMQQRALTEIAREPEAPWAPFAESSVLGHLGNIAVGRGEIDAAEAYFTQALERQAALGYEPGTSHPIANHPIAGLGDVARARGDLPAALAHYRHGLELAHRVHDYRATIYALGGVAGTLAAAGDWQGAARLFGASEVLHERGGFSFDLETMDRQRALGLPEPWLRATDTFGSGQPLRDALWSDQPVPLPPVLDPDAATALWTEGRARTLDEAVAEGLAATLPQVPPSQLPFGLSERELEVLRLLVAGATDPEIAAALYISRRTVASHVAHIYDKLGVGSRAEAAAMAVRHGLAE